MCEIKLLDCARTETYENYKITCPGQLLKELERTLQIVVKTNREIKDKFSLNKSCSPHDIELFTQGILICDLCNHYFKDAIPQLDEIIPEMEKIIKNINKETNEPK